MSAAPARIKVVICEDQPPILKNQVKILQDSPEVEVIGTALSGEAVLELLEKKQPDVLLQDLGLPRMTGIEVTRRLREEHLDVPVILLTARARDTDVEAGADAGADVYVTKPFSPQELESRVRAHVHG